jgi:CheY-like chemotaxis protein
MIEMMGGEIAVESEYGKGSVFSLRIRQGFVSDAPIGEETAENLKNFNYCGAQRLKNSKLMHIHLPYARVLVVDDVPTNLDVAKGMMKPYGMKIDCVTSGQRAIDLVRKAEVRYNAIFMDHMMPGMDGIEAARVIREEIGTEYARTIPIIALTANAIVGTEEIFLRRGFQAFLTKPIDVMRMDTIIRQWVRDKELEKQLEAEDAQDAAEVKGKTAVSQALSGRVIEGFDLRRGLERFGCDEEAFLEVLASYAVNTKVLLEQVRSWTEERLSDYAITVHGIKGSSYGIGAQAAGELAERLERAAKRGDAEFVRENNGVFVALAEKLVSDLSAMLEDLKEAKPEKDKPQKTEPDAALLASLGEACGRYDMDAVDAAMKELESFDYETGSNLVAWLREQIRVMNFKQVREKLTK